MKKLEEVMIEISIIIPIYNEAKYIKNCLQSIIECDFDKNKMEVILVDGGSIDGTIEIIKNFQKKNKFIKFFKNPQRYTPISMNIGIKNSKGSFLFIISAHAKYKINYFKLLLFYIKKLNADCVGPVLITEVKNKTNTSIAIKNVLSDKLGVGSAFRSGVNEIKEVDTVPFGCYKREVFDKIGYFDERLIRNQDIEFNKRLKKAGGKIYIIPEIKCTYFARETYKDLAINNFENGKWNILTAFYTKSFSSLSIRHFIPLIFVLTFIISLFLSFFNNFFLFIFVLICGLYLTVISIRSLKIKRNTTFFHQVFAFLVLHFSYGFGSLWGIMELMKKILKRYEKKR